MLRNEPECEDNKGFIHFTRYNYLLRLKEELPKTVLDKSWPPAARLVQEVGADSIGSNDTRLIVYPVIYIGSPG